MTKIGKHDSEGPLQGKTLGPQFQNDDFEELREQGRREQHGSGICQSSLSQMDPDSEPMEPIDEEWYCYGLMDCKSSEWSNLSVREFSLGMIQRFEPLKLNQTLHPDNENNGAVPKEYI